MSAEAKALEDYLADPVGAARERMERARRVYDNATEAYQRHRREGGIVLETDPRETATGVKFRGATPEGRTALGWWQKSRAELMGAQEQLRYELQRQPSRTPGEDDIDPEEAA